MSVCLPPGLWQDLVIVLLSIAIFLLFSGLDEILAYLSYLTYPSSVHVFRLSSVRLQVLVVFWLPHTKYQLSIYCAPGAALESVSFINVHYLY